MFSGYEIKNYKGEETLFVYIDNMYEFARIKGNKKKKLKEIIKDFIEKNEIKFAGTTIAIVAGGLIIGNIFLNKSDDLNLRNSIISINLTPNVSVQEVVDNDFLNLTSLNEEKEEIKEVEEVKEEKKQENNVMVQENVVVTPKEKVNKSSSNNASIQKEVQNTGTTVTVFRSNGDVLNLELEEYLINVVAAEMPASFNSEALKAQTVLARTYALKSLKSGKMLTDTTSTQVYRDNNELKKTWGSAFDTYYNKIKNAVIATKGEVLKYNGDFIEAVYHSTSNGQTEDASNVWGNSFPYLTVVDSSLDKSVKTYENTTFISYDKLSNILGFTVDFSTEFSILERNLSSRVSLIRVGASVYDGVRFRNLLSLRSADFDIELEENGVNIKTRGYGHGVGMSQYGANEMAKLGYNYKDILSHYYKGTSLVKE